MANVVAHYYRSTTLWKEEEEAVDREWEQRLLQIAKHEKESDHRRLTWHSPVEDTGQTSDPHGTQGAILEGKRRSAMRQRSEAAASADLQATAKKDEGSDGVMQAKGEENEAKQEKVKETAAQPKPQPATTKRKGVSGGSSNTAKRAKHESS